MEFIGTGKIKRLEYEEGSEDTRVIKLFMGIYGVGPTTASKWYKNGLKSLEDLRSSKGGITLSPAQQVSAVCIS